MAWPKGRPRKPAQVGGEVSLTDANAQALAAQRSLNERVDRAMKRILEVVADEFGPDAASRIRHKALLRDWLIGRPLPAAGKVKPLRAPIDPAPAKTAA